jgi:hypothetical protein
MVFIGGLLPVQGVAIACLIATPDRGVTLGRRAAERGDDAL